MVPVSLSRPLDMTTRSKPMVDLDKIGLDLRYPRRKLDNRYQSWRGWYAMLLKATDGPRGKGRGFEFSHVAHGMRRSNYTPRTWPEKKNSGYLRKCTVKVSYKRGKGNDEALYNRKKIGYIARKEATLNPSSPFYETANEEKRCYTYEGSRKRMLTNEEAEKILGSDGVFRIILSPEDPGVDLSAFARKFIKESFSKAIGGYSPLWVAANHYNTEHPHVHILMSMVRPKSMLADDKNSLGQNQRYYFLKEDYVKNKILYKDACKILTNFLGPRTPEQERFYTTARIERMGITSIDKQISSCAQWDAEEENVMNIKYSMFAHLPFNEKQLIRRRLKKLEELTPKVRYDIEKKTWRLEAGWMQDLKKKDYLDSLKLTDNNSGKIIFDGRDTKPYKGVIKSFSIDDEDPEKLTFHIVDEKGKSHIIEERIGLDVDRAKLKEKEVQIGFLKNGTIPHLLNKNKFEKDGSSL